MQGICGTFFNLISFHSAHRMVAFLNLNITFQSLKLAWNQSVQSAPSMPVLCKPHHCFVKIKFLWKLYLYLWLEFSICVKGFKKVKSCCKLFLIRYAVDSLVSKVVTINYSNSLLTRAFKPYMLWCSIQSYTLC